MTLFSESELVSLVTSIEDGKTVEVIAEDRAMLYIASRNFGERKYTLIDIQGESSHTRRTLWGERHFVNLAFFILAARAYNPGSTIYVAGEELEA